MLSCMISKFPSHSTEVYGELGTAPMSFTQQHSVLKLTPRLYKGSKGWPGKHSRAWKVLHHLLLWSLSPNILLSCPHKWLITTSWSFISHKAMPLQDLFLNQPSIFSSSTHWLTLKLFWRGVLHASFASPRSFLSVPNHQFYPQLSMTLLALMGCSSLGNTIFTCVLSWTGTALSWPLFVWMIIRVQLG